MPIEKLRPSFTFDQDKIEQLKAVAPEAFADGKINWDALRAALGDHLEPEDAEAEHFGLFWPGKREARRLASIPSKGTLVPAQGEGIDEDSTQNIFIEGDNLEVLKLLQKSYAGTIKMIYIDPPYNTGNDFVYDDDFTDPLLDYLRKTNQSSKEGVILTTNPKTSGRFHSNWLSMMYPRLFLARQLLRDDGVIWISLDDGESGHLRTMCDEIFGEENFVANFIWEKRTTRENRRVFSFNHDYIFCFAKDKELFQASRKLLPLSEEALKRYSNPDNDSRGTWQSVSLNAQAGHATPAQFYTIKTPSGRKLDPPPGRCWSVTERRLKELIADNRIWFGSDGNNVPRLKVFLSEIDQGLTPHTLWKADEVGTTDSAKKALIELFGGKAVYETPKPVDLLRRIIQISTSETELVMDFFGGSCTTAHAMLDQNREDQGKRSFIMIQWPEPTPQDSEAKRAGFETIAEIGKERIRRVSKNLSKGKTQGDIGFKVFKYLRSNFKAWQDYHGEDIQEIETLFSRFETPLVDDWKPGDLLIEVILLQGFPLDSKVTEQTEFKKNQVFLVESPSSTHRLFVCLDKTIKEDTIERLKTDKHDIVVCLDSAISDEAKIRLGDTCNLKVI
jgi:adenine-specific DNA-methyltransferase